MPLIAPDEFKTNALDDDAVPAVNEVKYPASVAVNVFDPRIILVDDNEVIPLIPFDESNTRAFEADADPAVIPVMNDKPLKSTATEFS